MRHYMGVYVLMEKIKRGKERVNIAKLNPEDSNESSISGGYIVKRDHSEGGGQPFSDGAGRAILLCLSEAARYHAGAEGVD
jgi:hypothetical protein